jgi:elongation factor Ts
MTTITMDLVKQLRDETGVSIMQCKKALEEMAGDYEKAKMFLRKKSAADAAKKGDRELGAVCSAAYIHQGGKVGAMVQLACETDFVSGNPEFMAIANDIAVHIAGFNPEYVKEVDISEEIKNKSMAFFMEEAAKTGKPEAIQTKIAEGKWTEFVAEKVLLNQKFLKDDSKTIQDLINLAIQKFGENVTIVKFVRFA